MKLSTDDIKRIAFEHGTRPPCKVCMLLACAGWESFPSLFNESELIKTGSLLQAGDEEPMLDEFHPDGTYYWSNDAPIALDFHPYNRCELWQCRHCKHPFLRYTEYGGYYEDGRIRDLNPELLV